MEGGAVLGQRRHGLVNRSSARVVFPLLLLVATASLLVACGTDDDAGPKVPVVACDAAVDLGVALGEAPEDPDQVKSFTAQRLVPIGATLAANLTGQAKTAAITLRDTLQQIAELGDPAAFESDAAARAKARVGQAIREGCDLEAVDIEAKEYAFVDVPASVRAGRVSIRMENVGAEDHEMVMLKRNDDATESLADLLALPDEEAMAKVTVAGLAWGPPGSTNYLTADLDSGTYFLVCFIPQGGVDGAPPHFAGGMQATIEVTGS
jgi:hypothetical protein